MTSCITPWVSPEKWRVYPAKDLRTVLPISERAMIPVSEAMRWQLDGDLCVHLFYSPRKPGIYTIIAEAIIEVALRVPQGTASETWRLLNTRVVRAEDSSGDARYANFCAIFMAIWHDIASSVSTPVDQF